MAGPGRPHGVLAETFFHERGSTKRGVRYLMLWPVGSARKLLGEAKGFRTAYRLMPSFRSCKKCLVPLHGVFSIPFRMVGIRPSRKNPNLCAI